MLNVVPPFIQCFLNFNQLVEKRVGSNQQ